MIIHVEKMTWLDSRWIFCQCLYQPLLWTCEAVRQSKITIKYTLVRVKRQGKLSEQFLIILLRYHIYYKNLLSAFR